ncbi:hypothetical protein C8Q80DRAFT_447012 [Daedaleopsis nitida]|nr:hypothetical protein C8Q80DRAFT_447012 [Daedaleopsis nitida]
MTPSTVAPVRACTLPLCSSLHPLPRYAAYHLAAQFSRMQVWQFQTIPPQYGSRSSSVHLAMTFTGSETTVPRLVARTAYCADPSFARAPMARDGLERRDCSPPSTLSPHPHFSPPKYTTTTSLTAQPPSTSTEAQSAPPSSAEQSSTPSSTDSNPTSRSPASSPSASIPAGTIIITTSISSQSGSTQGSSAHTLPSSGPASRPDSATAVLPSSQLVGSTGVNGQSPSGGSFSGTAASPPSLATGSPAVTPSTTSNMSAGAIAGIVLAVVCALVLLGAGALRWWRRRKVSWAVIGDPYDDKTSEASFGFFSSRSVRSGGATTRSLVSTTGSIASLAPEPRATGKQHLNRPHSLPTPLYSHDIPGFTLSYEHGAAPRPDVPTDVSSAVSILGSAEVGGCERGSEILSISTSLFHDAASSTQMSRGA